MTPRPEYVQHQKRLQELGWRIHCAVHRYQRYMTVPTLTPPDIRVLTAKFGNGLNREMVSIRRLMIEAIAN